ncbi:hypothetical protein CBR_g9078 [Chara braunii]|uniref:Peptidase A2 domain-containing protein n=1 Tax=Chara braunii TaxID=69332 RepID=A0A388KNZ6_CHABU|nr:hypothetical protein CBR_g9078 [Chara braunii]|eukprot:GBG71663.1 hypothetical protein CBR_g9078 [Chara braunii]
MEVNAWTTDSNGLTEMCRVIPEINGQASGNKMARWLSPPVYSSGPEIPIEVRDGVFVVLPEEGKWTNLEPAYETVMLDEKDAFLWIKTIWTKVSLMRLSPSLMGLEFRGTVEARRWVYLSQELENAMVVGLVLGTASDQLFRQAEREVVWAACQRAEMEMERMEVRVELGDRKNMRRPLRTMRCVLPPFLVDAVLGTRDRLELPIASQESKGECVMAQRRTFLKERPLGIEPPREVLGGVEVSLPTASEGWHQVADWVGVELAENMIYLVTKVEWRADENGEWNPDPRGHVHAEGRLYVSEDGWREFGVWLASGEDPLSMFEGAWQLVWQAGFEFADPGVDDVTTDLRVAMVGSFELPSENARMRLPPFLLERLGGLGLIRQAVADLVSLTYEDAMVHREYYRAFLEMGPFSGEQKYEVLRILRDVFSTRPRAPVVGDEVLWGVIRREISQGMVYVDDLYRLGPGDDLYTDLRVTGTVYLPELGWYMLGTELALEIEKQTSEFKARLIEQMMAEDEEDPQGAGPREGRRTGEDGARYEGKDNSHKGTPSKKGKDKNDPPTEETENAMTPPAIDSGTSRLPVTPKLTGACDGLWNLRERVLGWFDPEGTPKTREKQRESKEGEGTSAAGEAGGSEDGLKRVVATLTRTLNKNQRYLADAKKKLTFDGANIMEFLIDYENLAALLKWTEEEKMEHLGQHMSLSLGRDIMAIVASSGSWKETRNEMMRKYLKAEKMATEAELAAVQRKNYATYNDFLRAFTLVALRIPGVTDRIMSKYFLRQFSEFDRDKILSAYQQTSKFEYTRDVDFNTVTDLVEKIVVTEALALLKEGEVINLTGKTGYKVKKGIESLHERVHGVDSKMDRMENAMSLKGEILGPRGERVNWNSSGGMRRAVILLNNLEIAAVEAEPIVEIVWDQPRGRGPQTNFILEGNGQDRVNITTRRADAEKKLIQDTIMEELAGTSTGQQETEAGEQEKVYGKPREDEPVDKATAAKKKFRYQIPIPTSPEIDGTLSKLLGTMVSVSFQTMLQASPRLLKGLRQLLMRKRVEVEEAPELQEQDTEKAENLQSIPGGLRDLEKAFADIRLSLPDREGGKVMRAPPRTKLSFHALPVGKLKVQIGTHHTDALVDDGAEITLIRRDFATVTGCTVNKEVAGSIRGAGGEIPFTGYVTKCAVRAGIRESIWSFQRMTVMEEMNHDIILGRPWCANVEMIGMHLHEGTYMVDIEDPVTDRGKLLRLLGTGEDPPKGKLATWSPTFKESARKGAFARMEGMRERVEIMIEEAFSKKEWIKMGLPHECWNDKGSADKFGIAAETTDLLRAKIDSFVAEPTASPYANKWFVFRKSNKTLRWIQDLQKLNAVTIRDAGSLPQTDMLAESHAGRSIYSLVDLYSGYDQLPLDARDRPYTAMHTPVGQLQMQVTLMDFTNAVAEAPRRMLAVTGDIFPEKCEPYIDDNPVKDARYKDETEVKPGVRKFVWDHLQDIEDLLQRFLIYNITASGPKSILAVPEVTILGFRCGAYGRRPDPAKTDKISQWPTPLRTTTEVRAFLGVVGFWWIFIKGFAKIAEPIRAMIREAGTMDWTEDREAVAQTLKDILSSDQVTLTAPCFNDEGQARRKQQENSKMEYGNENDSNAINRPEEGQSSRQAEESSSRKRKLYVGFDHNLVVNRGGRKQGTRGPSPLKEGEPIELPSDSDPSSKEEGNPEEGQRSGENEPIEFIDLTSDEEEDEVTTPTREDRGREEDPGEEKDPWKKKFGPTFSDWFDQWASILRYQWAMKDQEKLSRGEDISPTTFFSEETLRYLQTIKRLMEQEMEDRVRREARRRAPGQ